MGATERPGRHERVNPFYYNNRMLRKPVLWLAASVIVALAAGCAGNRPSSTVSPTTSTDKKETPLRAEGKHVLMVIAPTNFRDEEYQKPREILEKAGASVTVASLSTTEATGMLGLKVRPNLVLSDVDADDYDAVIFVGGGGASTYFDDKNAQSIAKEAAKSRTLGAICLAPQILANANLLEGKRATVFKSQVNGIKAKGAIYTGEPVERDGNIITADGPASATAFGEAILSAIGSE